MSHALPAPPPLRPEEYEALKADIAKWGILSPVERDEDGNPIDGHHREQIAENLGIDCPVTARSGWTKEQKRNHALKANLYRRHLDPVRWGRCSGCCSNSVV